MENNLLTDVLFYEMPQERNIKGEIVVLKNGQKHTVP